MNNISRIYTNDQSHQNILSNDVFVPKHTFILSQTQGTCTEKIKEKSNKTKQNEMNEYTSTASGFLSLWMYHLYI